MVSGTTNNYSIGNGAAGTLTINGGSSFTAGTLTAANGGTGNGTITVDGAGTTVTLNPVGNVNVIQPGNWGIGSLTVSGGAVFDATNVASCSVALRWCNSFVANGAGSVGTLTITDTGSTLSLSPSLALIVGQDAVIENVATGSVFGTPGGTSSGSLKVLSGGTLNSGASELGTNANVKPLPPGLLNVALGTETAAGNALINGSNTVWNITSATSAGLNLGEGANSTGNLTISNGGAVNLGVTSAPLTSVLNLGGDSSYAGGSGMITVNGGSLNFTSGSGDAVNVGRNQGSGTMTVDGGGTVSGFFTGVVGRDGSTGSLTINGPGSSVSLSGSSAAGGAFLDVGQVDTVALAPMLGPSTNGTLTVDNGGILTIDLDNNVGGGFQAGRNGGTGTVTVTGAGSRIVVSGDNSNTTTASGVGIGRSGTGALNILAGGNLTISNTGTGGNSGMAIGGTPGQVANGEQPGTGTVVVSGGGSQLDVQSPHGFITAGYSGTGTLDVANGGAVSAEGITVGRSSGSLGTVSVDGAASLVTLAGADAAGGSGARFQVGGSGIGNASITNGAQLLINPSAGNGGIYVGGTDTLSGGVGAMTVSGGSTALVNGTGDLLMVGGNGIGTLTITNGSGVNVAASALSTGQTFVGAAPASFAAAVPISGTITVANGSLLDAGSLLGIASNGVTDSAGTGVVIFKGGTINATKTVIGTNGVLDATGTLNGDLASNGGTVSPGAPPDKLQINGNFAQTGGNINLEIDSDGHGGFLNDKLVFENGIDFGTTGATISFHFLDDANPNTFAADGLFNLDTFFRFANADGTDEVPLSSEIPGMLDSVFVDDTYLATADNFNITSFAFDPNTGVTELVATPTPEPSAAGLLASGLLGLAGIGYVRRRRSFYPRFNGPSQSARV